MYRRKELKFGLLWLCRFQHGFINFTYISCGHIGGQGRRVPFSKAANSSAVPSSSSLPLSNPGRFGSSPKLKVSYIVTPNDHTSERDENLPSLKLSGAYLRTF